MRLNWGPEPTETMSDVLFVPVCISPVVMANSSVIFLKGSMTPAPRLCEEQPMFMSFTKEGVIHCVDAQSLLSLKKKTNNQPTLC